MRNYTEVKTVSLVYHSDSFSLNNCDLLHQLFLLLITFSIYFRL